MLSSLPWIYLWLKEYYLGKPMLKYWQHTVGLFCLCQRKTYDLHASRVGEDHQCKTSGQHASPSGPPQKKLQNIFNSRTWTQAGEQPLRSGSDRQVTAVSKQSCSFCIVCCPARTGHETQCTQLTREEITLQTAIPRAAPILLPRQHSIEWGSTRFMPPEGGDRFQELEGAAAQQRQVPSSAGFNLTKGSAQLAPPRDLFKSVDSDSSSTQKGPKRSYNVLKERQATLPLLSLAWLPRKIALSVCPSAGLSFCLPVSSPPPRPQ